MLSVRLRTPQVSAFVGEVLRLMRDPAAITTTNQQNCDDSVLKSERQVIESMYHPVRLDNMTVLRRDVRH